MLPALTDGYPRNVWWIYLIVAAVLILGIYGFLTLAGFERRSLTRKTHRRAEDMYDNYADRNDRDRRRE
jgi:hypothetical protein